MVMNANCILVGAGQGAAFAVWRLDQSTCWDIFTVDVGPNLVLPTTALLIQDLLCDGQHLYCQVTYRDEDRSRDGSSVHTNGLSKAQVVCIDLETHLVVWQESNLHDRGLGNPLQGIPSHNECFRPVSDDCQKPLQRSRAHVDFYHINKWSMMPGWNSQEGQEPVAEPPQKWTKWNNLVLYRATVTPAMNEDEEPCRNQEPSPIVADCQHPPLMSLLYDQEASVLVTLQHDQMVLVLGTTDTMLLTIPFLANACSPTTHAADRTGAPPTRPTVAGSHNPMDTYKPKLTCATGGRAIVTRVGYSHVAMVLE